MTHLKTILGLGLIAMVLLSVANVVSRYVLDSALLWADEAVIFAMIVLVWLGGIVCAWDSSALRMSLLVDGLPSQFTRWVHVAQHLVVACACGFAAWLSYGFVAKVYRFGMTAEATGIPVWTVHVSITISLCLIAVLALWNAAADLGLVKGPPGLANRSSGVKK